MKEHHAKPNANNNTIVTKACLYTLKKYLYRYLTHRHKPNT